MISPINPLKDTPTKSLNIGRTLLLFGLSTMAGSLILTHLRGPSGDSTIQKNVHIMHQSIQPSTEIK